MNIVHVGSESAFVDFLVRYFERAAPGQNTVVRFPKAVTDAGAVAMARAAGRYARQLAGIVLAARRADIVVAHMMTLPSALAIVSAPSRAFSIWSGWGSDYYRNGMTEADGLLGPQTARLAVELHLDRGPQGGRPIRLLTERLIARAIRRVNAFSAPIPDDVNVMRQHYPGFRGAYHQLNYADIESFTARSTDPPGRDILLGNSAWAANNHFEALERLSTLDLQDRKVFTPLAYGDRAYRDAVISRGRRLLGDSFDPLLEPMPFEKYLDRVSSCGIQVMNHYRQQGLGNVGIGLHSGAHIYLSRRNPLYAFLDRSRLDVYDLETVTSLPNGPVTGVALKRRREQMKQIWGEDVVLENVRRLLDSATSVG